MGIAEERGCGAEKNAERFEWALRIEGDAVTERKTRSVLSGHCGVKGKKASCWHECRWIFCQVDRRKLKKRNKVSKKLMRTHKNKKNEEIV
ncbi:MAG: hypothetical protein LUC83_11345 [Clostridiales bacterium]|nr:hypothetical protein [Clostridiales bacterium]